MKNVLITAIGLVAFSVASMANTREVKVVVEPVKELKTVIQDSGRTPCDSIWIAYYTIYINTHIGSAGSRASWGYADVLANSHGCQ